MSHLDEKKHLNNDSDIMADYNDTAKLAVIYKGTIILAQLQTKINYQCSERPHPKQHEFPHFSSSPAQLTEASCLLVLAVSEWHLQVSVRRSFKTIRVPLQQQLSPKL